MPYVIVKMHTGRDEATKSKLADDLFKTMQDSMGLPPTSLTIDIQETPKEEWQEKVKDVDIAGREAEMYYLSGVKQR